MAPVERKLYYVDEMMVSVVVSVMVQALQVSSQIRKTKFFPQTEKKLSSMSKLLILKFNYSC